MFVQRKVHYSALFTILVGWHIGAISFPLNDVIVAQLACPLSDVMFYLHSRATTKGQISSVFVSQTILENWQNYSPI